MYTIMDYLKYYKNRTIKEVAWNDIDNLFCAIMSYVPVKEFKRAKTFNTLMDEISKINPNKITSNLGKSIIEMSKILNNSKRYKDMIFTNFMNSKDDFTQFGAITIRLGDITIVSFKGTDGSTIGWLENFRLIYDYPTYTQTLAYKYLTENISIMKDNNVYVVGHSKGGNLAMASVMELNKFYYSKIKKVYSFDGPGFRLEEYNSDKYKMMAKKLVNYIPVGSVIGVLLNNRKYKVVKTNTIGGDVHYPTNWSIFGEYFVEGKMSNVSREIHEMSTNGLETIDKSKFRYTIETLFKTIEANSTDKMKITLKDIVNTYKKIKNVDNDTKNYFDKIMNFLYNMYNK